MIRIKKRPHHYHPIHIVPEKDDFLIVVVMAAVAVAAVVVGLEINKLSLALCRCIFTLAVYIKEGMACR